MHCVCDEVQANGYTLDHYVEIYPAKTGPSQSKVLSCALDLLHLSAIQLYYEYRHTQH